MMNTARVSSPTAIDPALPRYSTVMHMLRAAAEACPDRQALVCDGASLTFGELSDVVAGLGRRLRGLSTEATTVAVLIPNSIETIVAALGAMASGARTAILNPFLKIDELRPLLADAAPSLIMTDGSGQDRVAALAGEIGDVCLHTPASLQFAPADRAVRETHPLGDDELPAGDDDALILYTGGTTGIPKGVLHSHRGLAVSVYQHCSAWPVEFEGERFLSVAPFFHIWGLIYACLVPIFSRNTLYIVKKYEPDVMLSALAGHAITVFAGGPAAIYAGLANGALYGTMDFPKLKYCLTGGAPCPEALHQRWRADTDCRLLEGWGMTEIAPLVLTPARGKQKITSVGLPVPETDIEIVDLETGNEVLAVGEAGEVRVRGPQMMRGYLNRPQATAGIVRDGWLHTGDIGLLDEDGYLFLVDRKKDMVIVGGYNVYPRQVDEVLAKHPAVREVATVGKAHERLGEVLVAFVVVEPGAELSEAAFFAYCEERFVKYKRPEEVHFLTELPRTGVNKIDKLRLRARANGKDADQ